MTDSKKDFNDESALLRKLTDSVLQSRAEDAEKDQDPGVSERLRWLRQCYRDDEFDSIIDFHQKDIGSAPDQISIEGCVYGAMSLGKRGRRQESLASLFVAYAYADDVEAVDAQAATRKSRILNQAGIRVYHLSEEKDHDRPQLLFKRAWQFCMTHNDFDYGVIVNWAAMVLQRAFATGSDMNEAISEADGLFSMLLDGWPEWQESLDFIDVMHRDVSLQDYIGSPQWKKRFGGTQPS